MGHMESVGRFGSRVEGMSAAPKRRWTFSLRTPFMVVTVFACWMGNELYRVRERRAMAQGIERLGGDVGVFPSSTYPQLIILDIGRVVAFGDLPAFWIQLPQQKFTETETSYVRFLFPNVRIDRYPMKPQLESKHWTY
jgi:hypothetical protein